MPIRWLSHTHQNEWIEILQVKPGDNWYCRLSPFADFWLTTELHWCRESRKNVPCLGKGECILCPRPLKYVTYVPCAALRVNGGQAWVKRILPVTDSFRWILQADLGSQVWSMSRRHRNNEPIRVLRAALDKAYEPVPGFAMEVSLRKCWGAQGAVDRSAAAG